MMSEPMMDPDFRAASGHLLDAVTNRPPIPHGDVASRRTAVNALMRRLSTGFPAAESVERTSVTVAGVDGAPIPAVWLRPTGDGESHDGPGTGSGAALYIHGGGLILGELESYLPLLSHYVERSRVPLLAVGYRLAPEHPYPFGLLDCWAALRHLHAHAAELGVDRSRIGVMGDSAGGGLAAALCHLVTQSAGSVRGLVRAIAGDAPDPDLRLDVSSQILVYPMLDDRNLIADPERARFAFWNHVDNATAWEAYLGHAPAASELMPTASPSRAADGPLAAVSRLPRAYLEVGTLDIFLDETIAYERLLARAGVDTELHIVPGVPHSFEWIAPDIGISRGALDLRIAALARLDR